MSKVEKVPKLLNTIRIPNTEEDEEEERQIDEANDRAETNTSEKTDKVCEMYKEGICPHGLVGRNCKDKHPRHCPRHCQYGVCRWGNKCWFLHPKLCENSRRTRTCYNDDCKKTHLRGTKRVDFNFNYRPEEERESRYQQKPRYRSNSVNVWSETRERRNDEQQYTAHKKQPRENREQAEESTQAFLAKCIEGVKTELFSAMNTNINSLYTRIREENRQMVQQYAPRPIITAVPVPNQALVQNHVPAQSQEIPRNQTPNPGNIQNAVYPNLSQYQMKPY